jgi:formate dehydrogenase iron-sulfur subunit
MVRISSMSGNATEHPSRTLIDDLLAEQHELTAVEEFARAHDAGAVRSRLYRDLLPATPPAPGQQYAFEVDLDKCFGCKACVGACHSLNGLDDRETWRSTGLLIGDPAEDLRSRRGAAAFQQHVTTACHHCVDPGCLNGCPVLAYDKDPLTGIVRHLDDQCIGCQYCVMMCPYEVPQYSKARGIVRKCDMCHSRLAVGEAPACVQACPSSAITITVVEQAKVRGRYRSLPELNPLRKGEREKGRKRAEEKFTLSPLLPFTPANSFLPASPNPAITLPTTRYTTARTLPESLFSGDHSALRPSDPHWPLVFLLVLSQLAVGASIAAMFVRPALPLLIAASTTGLVAVIAGSLHLGQPLKAWRSFLGWRKSWFSREVIAMSAFVFFVILAAFVPSLTPLTVFAGIITVTCSAMIYVDTRREFWDAKQSFTKFFGATLLLGAAVTLPVLAASTKQIAFTASAIGLIALTVAKLSFERRIFDFLVDEEAITQTPLNKTARLLQGKLNFRLRIRIALALGGGVVLPLVCLAQSQSSTLAVTAQFLCIAGEMLERHLFFTAVVTQKMPGNVAA